VLPQLCACDEIVLIDDGCMAADTRAELERLSAGPGVPLQYHQNESPGLTRGRNLGARVARGEVLQYLDDDVTCIAGFFEELRQLFLDLTVAGVTATVEEPAFSSSGARLYQLGYRIAGWWAVRPRGKPSAAPPAVLQQHDRTRRARWLSGAAMALRRRIVLEEPFDESLTRYALGEDREMGYRLSPRYWLLESLKCRVIHRRDMSMRTDSRRLGFMTARNYLYILSKTCRLGPGDWLLIVWSLSILAAMHLVWAVVGDRSAHLRELRGMAEGVCDFALRGRARQLPPMRPLDRPIRALFVTNRLEPGGAERMLVALVQRLARHGVQPLIACLKDEGVLAPECRQHGVPVFDRLLRSKFDVFCIQRMLKLFDRERIDLVVVGHSGGDRMFWSTIAARFAGLPVAVWSHWFPDSSARHLEFANRFILGWVDLFVALGRLHREALARYEHVPIERIEVISNAIDLSPFSGPSRRAEIRGELKLAEGDVAVAIIANLRTEKRHDVFIEAAKRLHARQPALRFFIAGDGPHREAVRDWVAQSGLPNDVLRLLGTRDDVPALLSAMDISCLCSEKECFSVTMFEAAAAGCVFIGPDTGCMTEFLEDGETGLIIKPADVASLTDAIDRLATDPALRQRLAERAKTRVIEDFDIMKMAASFADLCSGIVGRGRRV
jgi:glycosyltransferase involved in cell wall biosynthesis/GT2 family glycosyltransferase